MQVKQLSLRSLKAPEGFQIPYNSFSTEQELKDHVKGDFNKILDYCDKYGRQKDCAPEALDLLSEIIDTATDKPVEIVAASNGSPAKTTPGLGFPAKTKTEKVDGKDVVKPNESNADHINRWVAAQPDKTAAWTKLKGFITLHGPFSMDLNSAVRTGGKVKVPKYLVEAATNILNNEAKGSVKTWINNFTKGYTSEGYGDIEPVAFAPFDVKPVKGATAEQVQATRQANIEALGRALMQVEEQKRNLRKDLKKEYA